MEGSEDTSWLHSGNTLSGEDRVLVVDDDPVLRHVLRVALQREDREIHFAEDGQGALEKLTGGGYHVMLLDLGLPGISGQDVLEWAARVAPDTDVVVITATDEVPVAVAALQAGARDFLIKPLDLDQIARVIEKVVANRRERIASNIARVVHGLASTQDMDRLPPKVVDAARAATRSEAAAVFALDAEGFSLLAYQGTGQAGRLEDLAHRVLSEGEKVRLEPELDHGSAMGWPMIAHSEAVGVIAVSRTAGSGAYTHEDEQKLSIVATEAALSLDRARLVARLRQQVDELARARMQLSAAEQLQGVGQLATGYAHELQGPIQYLRGHLRGAVEAANEERYDDLLQRLEYATEGVDRIQSSVGDLSLLGRNRDDAEIEAARLVHLARRMVGEDGAVAFEEEVDSATVAGNVGHLVQALVQLLRNAVLASAQVEQPAIRIRVRREDDGMVRFDVIDNGPGISKEDARRAFEPFWGTWGRNGLGLGVAREIARNAGGRVSLAPVKGGGTRATLRLPAATSEEIFAFGEG